MNHELSQLESELSRDRHSLSRILFTPKEIPQPVVDETIIKYLNTHNKARQGSFAEFGCLDGLSVMVFDELALIAGYLEEVRTPRIVSPDLAQVRDLFGHFMGDEYAAALNTRGISAIGRASTMTLASYFDEWRNFPGPVKSVITPLR